MPQTKLGWWAIGLAAASIMLLFAWSFLPWGAWPSFLCGLAAGIIALIAIVREHERSWLVLLSLLPLLNLIVFLLGEFIVPH
jgi:hypothetical protein